MRMDATEKTTGCHGLTVPSLSSPASIIAIVGVVLLPLQQNDWLTGREDFPIFNLRLSGPLPE